MKTSTEWFKEKEIGGRIELLGVRMVIGLYVNTFEFAQL